MASSVFPYVKRYDLVGHDIGSNVKHFLLFFYGSSCFALSQYSLPNFIHPVLTLPTFQTVITMINHAIGASGVVSMECKAVVEQYGPTIMDMLSSGVIKTIPIYHYVDS